MGSNSAVASFPPYLRMTLDPPGCSDWMLLAESSIVAGLQPDSLPGRKSVTL